MGLQKYSEKSSIELFEEGKKDKQRLEKAIPSHIPAVTDTLAWKEIQDRENRIGSDVLLEELLEKKFLNDEEMLWIVRYMMAYYGKGDVLLKKAPVQCLLSNTNELLRVIFLLLDQKNGSIEMNMRSYLSAKLQQATWGINSNTRRYLKKLDEKMM